jgi:acetyltransferase-like isoleucine patch superfamily enzyme
MFPSVKTAAKPPEPIRSEKRPRRRNPSRLIEVLRQELANLNLRLYVFLLCALVLPDEVGGRMRSVLLRLAGLRIGRGTIFNGRPAFSGGRDVQRLLSIGQDCWLNVGCRFDVHAPITIGNEVRFGQEVLILTHTHILGSAHRRAGELLALPVTIGDGAWIGARVTILPGVSIGKGAVIAAGAVVNRDIEPNTMAGGVPAKPVRELP